MISIHEAKRAARHLPSDMTNSEIAEIVELTPTVASRKFLKGLIKWFDPKAERDSIILILREAKQAGII